MITDEDILKMARHDFLCKYNPLPAQGYMFIRFARRIIEMQKEKDVVIAEEMTASTAHQSVNSYRTASAIAEAIRSQK